MSNRCEGRESEADLRVLSGGPVPNKPLTNIICNDKIRWCFEGKFAFSRGKVGREVLPSWKIWGCAPFQQFPSKPKVCYKTLLQSMEFC